MSLIDDWKAYVQKPSAFGKHHFESLMLELATPEQYYDAFDNLPAGRTFADRLVQFRSQTNATGTYLVPFAKSVSEESKDLAETYRDSVVDYLRETNDSNAQIIESNPIVEMSVVDYRSGKKAGSLNLLNIMMNIEFDYFDAMDDQPSWIDGLYEAVYMMTTLPTVTRYLLSPILKFPIDDKAAASLWLNGGHRVDFCKDRTLLIIDGPEQISS